MSLTSNPTSLKAQLDSANPNTLPSKLQALKVGSMFAALPTTLHKKVPAASPYILATEQAVPLPEDVKAISIFAAYAKSGTGTPGPLAVVSGTPVAGQIAVAPNGDVVTLAADAWTDVDVTYLPAKYDVVEMTLPVVANVLALPPAVLTPGASILLEAEAVAAGSLGKKIVMAPGTAVAAGQSALNLAKSNVAFAAADAVTSARVKLAVAASVDVQALLEAPSTSL